MKPRHRKRALDQARSHLYHYELTAKGRAMLLRILYGLRGAIDSLMQLYLDPAPDTPEGQQLQRLVTVAERIEQRLYPFPMPSPIEMAEFYRDLEAAND